MSATTERPRFRVERNVPPPARPGSGRPPIYPLDDMEPGDSFLVPGATKTSDCPGVYSAARSKGLKVTGKVEPEGVRFWLVGLSSTPAPSEGAAR